MNPKSTLTETFPRNPGKGNSIVEKPQETQHEQEAEQESLSLACVSRCMVLGNSSNRDNPIKGMINFVISKY